MGNGIISENRNTIIYIDSSNNDTQNSIINDYQAVVGIDFGSSTCGFAYSFKNSDTINSGFIKGANEDNKIPTEIILDNENKIISFGNSCKIHLKQKGIKSGHYFKGIKMNLYHKKSTIISINSGKEFELKYIIQKVLEKLKKLAIDDLKSKWYNIDENKIKWVVTVPAIWGDYQKNIMMEACDNAGLINDYTDQSLFFALEPEAASLYCAFNGEINKENLILNKYYIICDLGGGTGDIVTHLIGNKEKIEEINPPSGGNYGSNEIDNKFFEDVVFKLFECKDFNSFLRKNKELNIDEDDETLFQEWCELERQIKDFKEGTTLELVQNKEKYPIKFLIFKDIIQNKNIRDLVNEYNKDLDDDLKLNVTSVKFWYIDIPYKIIYNYIEKQAKDISNYIENIIEANKKVKRIINTIIFVGGYCSNEIITEKIKDFLNQKIPNLKYLRPSNPILSVMQGAVIFGKNPKIINIRIAKYTIGQKANKIWDDKLHSNFGPKIYDKIDKVWRCENCFDKFIEINQELKIGQEIIHNYRMVDPKSALLTFYRTNLRNPISILENGVEEIGSCRLDIEEDYPLEESNFKVIMKFGGTFIEVKVIHRKNRKVVKTKLNYYSNLKLKFN